MNASEGFQRTGLTVALDGTEDFKIVREAGEFWKTLRMNEQRTKVRHDVHIEVEAGRLQWSYEDVYSVIADHPVTGILDSTCECQNDEIVARDEDDEVPWDNDVGREPIEDIEDESATDDEEEADAHEEEASEDNAEVRDVCNLI